MPRKPADIDKQVQLEIKKQTLKIAAQDKLIAELLAKVEREHERSTDTVMDKSNYNWIFEYFNQQLTTKL